MTSGTPIKLSSSIAMRRPSSTVRILGQGTARHSRCGGLRHRSPDRLWGSVRFGQLPVDVLGGADGVVAGVVSGVAADAASDVAGAATAAGPVPAAAAAWSAVTRASV